VTRPTGQSLRFRIVLVKPPAGVVFGIQMGKGANYVTEQKQQLKRNDLRFEFALGLAAGDQPGLPDFRGPGVQGRRGERFVYIDIGQYAGQTDTPWARRLKVPLAGITREMVSTAADDPKAILETRVPGTGRDGGPNCATVKPFDGWTLTRSTK
jgi:hypothetical protein